MNREDARWKRTVFLLTALFASLCIAGGIKTWSSNEVVFNSDLNANMQHLHANLGHNHGAVLVNGDISSSASIAHTKLAVPALVPKLWAQVASCAANPCTILDGSGVTSVTRGGAGSYTATFPARANAMFGVLLSTDTASVMCRSGAPSTTAVGIECFTTSTLAATNAGFTLMVLDSDN